MDHILTHLPFTSSYLQYLQPPVMLQVTVSSLLLTYSQTPITNLSLTVIW